jgi:uncharacterized protein YcfL
MKQKLLTKNLKLLMLPLIMVIFVINVHGQCHITTNIHTSAPDGICPGDVATLTVNSPNASTDCCPDEPLTGSCWDRASNTLPLSCNENEYKNIYKLNMRPDAKPEGYNSYCGGVYTNSFITKLVGSQATEGYFYERYDGTGFVKAEFTHNQDNYIFYINYTQQKKGTYNICLENSFTTNAVSYLGYHGFYINCRTGARTDFSYNGEPVYTSYDPVRNIFIIFGWYAFEGTAWYFEKIQNGVKGLAHCNCKDTEESNTYKWSTGATTKSITVNSTGNYSVTLTDCEGCSSTSTINVATCGVTIGDKIFLDQDKDGFQDFNEPGVSNIRVNLIDIGADGVGHTADDKVVQSVISDINGKYAFEKVTQGSYCINVISLSLPENTGFTVKDINGNQIDTADSDVDATGKSDVFQVGLSDITHIDVGIVAKPKLATIGNQVWNDLDKDGFRDPNEPGIADITVKLRSLNDETVMLTPTDANGNYQFTNVEPGQYRVMFVVPNILGDLKPSVQTGFADNNIDNNNDINGDNITTVLTFTAGENDQTIDAGFFKEEVVYNISVSDATLQENVGNGTFKICIDKISTKPVRVQYLTSNGTAQSGTDYVAVHNTATIPAGQKCVDVPVQIIDDNKDEPNETFIVSLLAPENGQIVDGQGTMTIVDNDDPIKANIAINDISINESAGTANVNVCINQASNQAVTVQYNTLNGTAQGGSDYTTINGTATISAGQTCTTIQVPIIDDNQNESTETFTINLFNPQNGTIVDGQGTVMIIDNDNAVIRPNITVSDISVNESTGTASANVCINQASNQAVTVQYNTTNGSAQSGLDYTGVNGTATIPAGQTCTTIQVPIIDDNQNEPNEVFTINLFNPQNGTIVDGQGTVTILDNDHTAPGGTCKDVVATGGNGQVTISNIPPGSMVQIQGPSTGWGLQLVCNSNCNSTQVVNNLGAGLYFIKIQTFSPTYCYNQISTTVTTGPVPCANQGGDSDKDGVCDKVDNCPNVYNPDQKDSNNNGIGDACEVAPCANQGGDSDKDGVCDKVDNCPNVYNPDQKDSNNNGIGDACEVAPCANQGGDSDKDGICDKVDNCPNVYNPDQKDSNNNGIGDACETTGGGKTCDDLVAKGETGQISLSNIPSTARVEYSGPSTGWGYKLVCDNNCSATQIIKGLTPGDYNVKIQMFSPSYCYRQVSVKVTTGGGNPCANQGGDSDGDGICNNVDNCPNVSNPDQKDSNNNGIGDACEFVSPCADQGGDTDGDSVCDNKDNCPNVYNPDQKDSNNNGIGDACETTGGGKTCEDVVVKGESGQISISNIPSTARVEYSGPSTGWGYKLVCDKNCSGTQVVKGLTVGTYIVRVQMFTPAYCYKQISVTVTAGGGNPCASQGGDSDNDGICDNKDNCPNVANPDQKDSNNNGIGDACETTGGNACDKVTASMVNGKLKVTGLSAPIVILKVFDSNWQTIFECTGNKCPETVEFSPDPNETTCHIDVKFYSSNWQLLCERSVKVTANGGASNRNAKQLKFEAVQAERAVSLQWLTNTGWRNSHFELERSTDGATFEKIGEISNKDLTDDLSYYEQTDKAPTVGTNYYRLKQVYQTGDHDYTAIKTVNFGIDLDQVSVFPNPAKTELFVNLKNLVGKKGSIQLTNQYGQVVKELDMGQIQTEVLKLNTADYTNGLYYLQIQLENQPIVVKKVMIHRLY